MLCGENLPWKGGSLIIIFVACEDGGGSWLLLHFFFYSSLPCIHFEHLLWLYWSSCNTLAIGPCAHIRLPFLWFPRNKKNYHYTFHTFLTLQAWDELEFEHIEPLKASVTEQRGCDRERHCICGRCQNKKKSPIIGLDSHGNQKHIVWLPWEHLCKEVCLTECRNGFKVLSSEVLQKQ